MTGWQTLTHITTPTTPEQLMDALHTLRTHGATGTLDPDGQHATITMGIDADTPWEAATAATILTLHALPSHAAHTPPDQTLPQPADPATPPRLLGYADIATITGTSRQRARAMADDPTFPQPAATTSHGPLYHEADIIGWALRRNRTPGRPRRD